MTAVSSNHAYFADEPIDAAGATPARSWADLDGRRGDEAEHRLLDPAAMTRTYPPGVTALGLESVYDQQFIARRKRLTLPSSGSVALSGGQVDMAGVSPAAHAPIRIGAGDIFTARGTVFRNAPRSYFLTFPGGEARLDGCWFGAFGQNTTRDDHGELGQARGGLIVGRRCIYDAGAGHRAMGGASGVFQLQSDAGPVYAYYEGCLWLDNDVAESTMPDGSVSIGIPALSLKAVNFPLVVMLRNCGITADPHGRRIVRTEQGQKCVVVDLGGNFDPPTLQPIQFPSIA
jgi:hypothetical protein